MLNLLLILTTAAVGSVRASCTHAAIKKAMMCTVSLKGEFLVDNSPNAIGGQIDASKAAHACGNGDLLTAINCIERVVDECKHENTDAAHFFLGMINIEKARRAINFFCTNVKVYIANAKCIADHHSDQNICAAEAMRNYETQVKATQNMDVLMRFQCLFYHEVVRCMDKVLTQKCSSGIADIATTIILGFEPPVCTSMSGGVKSGNYDAQSDAAYDNTGGASSCHTMTNVLLVLCSFILALKCLLLY